MNSRATSLAIATLIATAASAYLLQRLHAERQHADTLQSRVVELERARKTQPTTSRLSAAPVTPMPDAAPAVAQPTSPVERKNGATTTVTSNDLMKDPDFRASVSASLRQSLAQTYADVAKELDLSPEQARKLLDILANNALSISGVSFGGGSGTGNPRDAVRASADAQRQQDDEIRALLGESRLQQWKQYQQMVPAREQVVRLQTTLESAGGSLGPREQKQLIATMAAEKKRETEEMTRYMQTLGPDSRPNGMALLEKSVQAAEEGHRRVLDASQSYLSPQQLDALRAQQNLELGATRALLRAQRPREPARE